MKSSALPADSAIGDIARHFGLPTHVLRHWESQDLLRPRRAPSGHRSYTPTDYYRVAAILRAKEAGLTLDDLRALLRCTDRASAKQLLRARQTELASRVARLQDSLTLIERAMECEHEDLAGCPAFRDLLDQRVAAPSSPLPAPSCATGAQTPVPGR